MNISVVQWVPLLREALVREGHFLWKVEGESMLPTLRPGQTIEIRAVENGPRLGEILVFAERHALVVHRLVAWRGPLLIFQGDNRRTPDTPVAADQLLGRVARAYDSPFLIYPRRFMSIGAFFWIARYYAYRAVRVAGRMVHQNRQR